MINKLKEILMPKCLSALVPSKKAFSLAEVLITLGIIGVVAALTIPALINNYNTKTWNTAATVFERKLEDVLKTMNSQSTLAGHESTESFVEELSKHFKTNKICNNEELMDCFNETVYWGDGENTPEETDMKIIKTSKNIGQAEWGTNIVGAQFANGTSALIAYNPTETCKQDPHSNQVDVNQCLAILYDTSGYKNPNTIGKDLRANSNIKMLGCTFKIGNTCYTSTPFIAAPMSYEECAGENATSPGTVTTPGTYAKNLGIKYCYFTEDYWAGAVKACGGVSNLPSTSQLNQLANYIYNRTDITGDTRNITMDIDKVNSMGFTTTSFWVWTNSEQNFDGANYRNFYSTYSFANKGSRTNTSWITICRDN